MAHNKSRDPDSIPIDLTDCYDDDNHRIKKMMHSSGFEEKRTRGGAEFSDEDWPIGID